MLDVNFIGNWLAKRHVHFWLLIIYQNEAEIEKFKSEEVEMASQRKALLKNLEDSLSSSTEQADQYDTLFKQSKKILEQLKSGEINFTNVQLSSSSFLIVSPFNKRLV